jgi:hypothetical protein
VTQGSVWSLGVINDSIAVVIVRVFIQLLNI